MAVSPDSVLEPPILMRLFGPDLREVVESCRDLGPQRPIVWEVFPEVHVKCHDIEQARYLLVKYGASVFAVGNPAVREGMPSFARAVGAALVAAGWTLATAESCTGGLIGHLVTNVPGSSHYYRMGVVAYSNEAKVRVLGVPQEWIARYGAVSEPVVRAMAEGVRALAGSDVSVAVSGIAGPGGGTPEKPVGTVWMAIAGPAGVRAVLHRLLGDRERIKRAAAFHALDLARRLACNEPFVGFGGRDLHRQDP